MVKRSILSAGLLIGLATGCMEDTQSPTKDLPYGLWMWEERADPTRVEIELQRDGNTWTAEVNGKAADVEVEGATLTVPLPCGDRFEGEVSDDGSRLDGLWVQPETDTGYSNMATPISLQAQADGAWTAVFDEQARPFRVYLNVFELHGEGSFAVIRNPERNEVQYATRYRAAAVGDGAFELTADRGDEQVSIRVEVAGDTLLLPVFRFDEPLRLQRASETMAEAFYSRPPAALAQYQDPVQLDDGWPVTTAEDAGFNRDKLDVLVAELAGADPRARRPQMIHSLLVARHGELVVEEYFHGYDQETPHDVRSLGKVFATMLTGALLQDGVQIGVEDTPLPDILAEAGLELDDPRKSDITLDQILTYTTGLDCDDNRASPGAEDNMWTYGGEVGFWTYAATLPQLYDPGSVYAYCSAGINMAGYVLRDAGNAPILDTIDRLIAEPLEFSDYHWNLMPDGEAYLGGGAYLRPRDILKLGDLYASGGLWQGQRVLPEDWVIASTTSRIEISPETTGMSGEAFANAYFPGEQAYAWRVNDIMVGERSFRSYESTGNGGQILLVVPELELSVVFTGGNYFMGSIWGRWRDQIVGGHIIPAIEELN